VVDGESSEAGNPGTLGMTKRGGSLQGHGGCWMKQWLLNRRIVQIEFGQLFGPSLGDSIMFQTHPGLSSWANFRRPFGTESGGGTCCSGAERKTQPPGDTLDVLAALGVLLLGVQVLQHQRRIGPEL
jgi:hypothetical protein